ncbi:Signal transduction histidine kinase [Geodermatophilus siccatus]|uniref:histidine kinase n=1 Tax=Geodermatophilus siccatus TaxID=1137991 RepID=A0A1H0BH45_9ACTN|nr:HAMP domain-containing sensor histidine kinase [Geodermatophilus siccatus]SDN44956.1 Signal transduction histidine kinase [Geodermatophilus siccatus]
MTGTKRATTVGTTMAGTTTDAGARRRSRAPRAVRTRIIGWVLLLVLLALGIVTFVTWRLLIAATDERIDITLEAEIEEFRRILEGDVDPRTGEPFGSVEDVLQTLITYNLARPNEKFLGYVDGRYRYQSRIEAPVLLSRDDAFTREVGAVRDPTWGRYGSGAGEVRYLAVPVSLDGDPSRGVAVVAYFADQERQAADDAARLMLVVGAVTLLLAAGGAWVVAGRVLRPVRDVAATAHGITETDLSRRIPVDGRPPDELTDLAAAVNEMLDRLEAGSAAQRRFLDDAGHELRTPITIVRGHLEVLDPADPADVRETVALVDDELDRMNRIVSDLLLLARAEQPQFVRPQPVDVAALTAEVFDKVRRLGDRNWVLETAADVDAELDTQRVTQALVALADNAVRYTVPGDRISLGSQLSGGELRFWVSDTGPGVPEEEQARVFERFARGASGARRSDGAGLGLSVVRAIAVAHGGRAVLDSVPGRGTTVSLVLPARLAPPLADDATTVEDDPAPPELDPAAGRLRSGTRGGPS